MEQLKLEAIDRKALNLEPNSFSYWCDIWRRRGASAELQRTINELIVFAQTVDAGRFAGRDQPGFNVCTAAQDVLARAEKLSISLGEELDLRPIGALSHLRELRLPNNKLRSVRHLENLKSLKLLDLSDNRVEDLSMLSKLEALQTLNISNNRIRRIPDSAWPKLQSLDISYNGLACAGRRNCVNKAVVNAAQFIPLRHGEKNKLRGVMATAGKGRAVILRYADSPAMPSIPLCGGLSPTIGSCHTARESCGWSNLQQHTDCVGRMLQVCKDSLEQLKPSVELYTPSTGLRTGTKLNELRMLGVSALGLGDGRVLIAGGSTMECQLVKDPNGPPDHPGSIRVLTRAQDAVELYDPTTDKSTTLSTRLSTGRLFPGLVSVAPGRVLIYGGLSVGDDGQFFGSSQAELYNESSQALAPTSGMNVPRAFATASVLPSGKMLIIGGSVPGTDNTQVMAQRAELFDLSTNSFVLAAPLQTPRTMHVALPLSDGRILVVGGMDDKEDVIKSTEVYNPATDSFAASTINLVKPRVAANYFEVARDRFIILGGMSSQGVPDGGTQKVTESTAELLDVEKASSTVLKSKLSGRAGFSVVRLSERTGLIGVSSGIMEEDSDRSMLDLLEY
jgi:hypothetical protein